MAKARELPPQTVAAHLNHFTDPWLPWGELRDDQAFRKVGKAGQYVIKVGMSWTWLVTTEHGQVQAGGIDWNATPEDAARAADAALEAASNL